MAKTRKQKRFAVTAAYTAIRQIVIVQKAVMKALSFYLQRYSNPTLKLLQPKAAHISSSSLLTLSGWEALTKTDPCCFSREAGGSLRHPKRL